MGLEGFNSYKNNRDRKLLEALNRAILVLKWQQQKKPQPFTETDVTQSRIFLLDFLAKLSIAAKFLLRTEDVQSIDLDYVSVARQFLRANEHDVESALDNIRELRDYIQQNDPQHDDFVYLDRLQTMLETEVDNAIRGLYRL